MGKRKSSPSSEVTNPIIGYYIRLLSTICLDLYMTKLKKLLISCQSLFVVGLMRNINEEVYT